MCFYSFYGYSNFYGSSATALTVLDKAFAMNSLALLMACVLVLMLPDRKIQIPPIFQNLGPLYYGVIVYLIIYAFFTGSYQGSISGAQIGTLPNYLNQFIEPSVILVLILFYQRRHANIYLALAAYIALRTVEGSRGAALFVFILCAIYSPLFKKSKIYQTKILRVIIAAVVLSPVLFYVATATQGRQNDTSATARLIFNRISTLETALIPIDCIDNSRKNCNTDVFFKKYEPLRQLEQAIDSMYPGDIWVTDVYPNQYYRAAFLGHTEEYSQTNYMSINMTLPTYFYMYTDFLMACLLTAIAVAGYYLLMIASMNKVYLFAPLLLAFPVFLTGFDFVLPFHYFYSCLLTVGTVFIYHLAATWLKKWAVRRLPLNIQRL